MQPFLRDLDENWVEMVVGVRPDCGLKIPISNNPTDLYESFIPLYLRPSNTVARTPPFLGIMVTLAPPVVS